MSTCGNGIVEPGEDCDCGTNCARNSCCDTSCKFKDSAVCDHNDPLNVCCSACQFRASDYSDDNYGRTICRAAIDTRCDEPEYCRPGTATCPPDKNHFRDGRSCGSTSGDDYLYCASGACTSRNDQCTRGALGKAVLKLAHKKYGGMNETGGIVAHGFCGDGRLPSRSDQENMDAACRTSCVVGGPRDEDWWDCVEVEERHFLNGTRCGLWDGSYGVCVQGECVWDYVASSEYSGGSSKAPIWIIAPTLIGAFLFFFAAYVLYKYFRTKKVMEKEQKQREETIRTAELEGAFAPTVVQVVRRPAQPAWGGEAFAPRPKDMGDTAVGATVGMALQRTSVDSSVDENYGKVVNGGPVPKVGETSKGKEVVIVDTVEATGGESGTEKKPEEKKDTAGKSVKVTHTGRYF